VYTKLMHEAVVILGSRPYNPDTWEFPSHIYASLTRAAEMIKRKEAQYIAVSGKWTINFDILHIQQPFTECAAMANFLIEDGIPKELILQEAESKDTISNIYYLKRNVLKPNKLKKLHFISANERLSRVAFLCMRILGPKYDCTFEPVSAKPGEVSPNEARTLKTQAAFLKPMTDGDDAWLDERFFNDPFYDQVRARVLGRARLEPFMHLAQKTSVNLI
jgi:uncharacterized SAM-binding protein YcdF (DUF218 family)